MFETNSAMLVLADGTIFEGQAFGARATRGGEVVFNTAHSGYQEILTDPSYLGQIVCMTGVQQGNYGVNPEDDESPRIFAEGLAVREAAAMASGVRRADSLQRAMEAAGTPGISGLDTRALTRRLRTAGAINGVLSTDGTPERELRSMAAALPDMSGQDLVRRVSPAGRSEWTRGFESAFDVRRRAARPPDRHVVAFDCGMKRNILRHLVDVGCRVTIVPADTSSADVLSLRPDGVFASNGPGDPAPVTYLQRALRELAGRVPIFGICLGHQVLGLALGARTYKLKFGHHGANHPVKNLLTGRIEITSQNHGFAVRTETLAAAGLEPTHVNLYDGTNEGFRHPELPVLAVQYHPEAGPGPHDASYLFDCFRVMMDTGRPPTADEMRRAQGELAAAR